MTCSARSRLGVLTGAAALSLLLAGPGAATPGASAAASPSTSPVGTPSAGNPRSGVVELASDGTRARRASVQVSAPGEVGVGTRITVRGRATADRKRRTVLLTERSGGRWVRVTSTRTSRTGAFRVRLRAGQKVVTRRLRVQVKGVAHGTVRFTVRVTAPAPSVPAPPDPAAPSVTDPATPGGAALGGASDWSYLFADKARWNPCDVIGWGYDPAGGYLGSLVDLQTALGAISLRTGLVFAYRGRTGEDFNIKWATAASDGKLAGSVAGYAGARGRWLPKGSADVALELFEGFMVLDREAPLRKGFALSGNPTWGQVMLHEILHAMGLGHAEGRQQVMYGAASPENHLWGAGDLAGMQKIGLASGCLPTSGTARAATGATPSVTSSVLGPGVVRGSWVRQPVLG